MEFDTSFYLQVSSRRLVAQSFLAVLFDPLNVATRMNLRVRHPLRRLQWVGSCDLSPQTFRSSVFFSSRSPWPSVNSAVKSFSSGSSRGCPTRRLCVWGFWYANARGLTSFKSHPLPTPPPPLPLPPLPPPPQSPSSFAPNTIPTRTSPKFPPPTTAPEMSSNRGTPRTAPASRT
jgi:hypothetical protein